ncbi:MAG: GMC family oxidoreductase N-terminal domain-containing protein [Solirubrobacterales bacterium]
MLLVRLVLLVFDRLPFPWRFSRSDLAARQDFIAKLEEANRPLLGELLVLLKVLTGLGYGNDAGVRASIDYEITCRLEGGASPLPAPDPAPLGGLDPESNVEECDVAIVGSGAGGSVAAALLAEAGLDVVVVEAGPYMDRGSYPEEPLAALAALYRDGGLTIAEGRPAIPTPVGRAVGGTTVINSGTCFRAPGDVLARWRAQSGIEWASEMTPEYVQAEEMLDVAPVDPRTMGRNGQILMEAAEAMGLSHHPLSRNAGRCSQCSSCPQGCRLDAKRAAHVTYLPRAVAAGARVRSGVQVDTVVFEGDRATGVRGRSGVAWHQNGSATHERANGDGSGRAYELRARRAVVLAGGAFGTPELLLRSGFKSASGQLGQNLHIHPACWVGARFAEEVRGWDGVMQSYAVDEWMERGILLEATFTPLAFGAQWLPGTGPAHQERILSYDRIASTGVHLSDTSSGRVALASDGSLRITYDLTKADAEKLSFGIARACELFFAAGATEVYPQIAGIPTITAEEVQRLDDRPPRARRLRLEAFHPMGTAAMDASPDRGVADTDGAVHGARDLYIADGSLFPTSIGVNPMMTIIAMASRISRGLADTLT